MQSLTSFVVALAALSNVQAASPTVDDQAGCIFNMQIGAHPNEYVYVPANDKPQAWHDMIIWCNPLLEVVSTATATATAHGADIEPIVRQVRLGMNSSLRFRPPVRILFFELTWIGEVRTCTRM